MIAKTEKPHNIVEIFDKPSSLAIVRIVLFREVTQKIKAIFMLDNTVIFYLLIFYLF